MPCSSIPGMHSLLHLVDSDRFLHVETSVRVILRYFSSTLRYLLPSAFQPLSHKFDALWFSYYYYMTNNTSTATIIVVILVN
jgi:hypothetical protein